MARVLISGDTQAPFDHPDYLEFLKYVQAKYRTELFVHIGDEVDFHALSDFDHDPDGYSPGHELSKAIEHLKPYYRAFPKAMVCISNHTARIFTRAFRAGIPIAALKEYREVLQAPDGWSWKDKWEVDGVIYRHGKGFSGTMGALNAARDEMQSACIGHLHADAGLLLWSNGQRVLFGMNVGCGIDGKAYAFKYGKDSRKKPIISCAAVINGHPYLEIMTVDKHGRWVEPTKKGGWFAL